MAATMVITTLLMVTCHVTLVMGYYIGAMPEPDKSALKAMKSAIVNKENFPEITCGEFFSPISCDDSGRVYTMLISSNLQGSIAPQIGNLTRLRMLRIYSTNLSGSIPSSIGRLKSLTLLSLDGNKLSGSIPSSIGQLKSITYLDLSGNQLSGSIPSSIGQLKSLTSLYLMDNQLSGSIPSSIGQLTSLNYFDITNNYFTGPIIRVGGHPSCAELAANCLFGASLPKGCVLSKQRSKATCLSFCNATQVGGPCGGNGICSYGKDVKTAACACNQGYTHNASKFTCKRKA